MKMSVGLFLWAGTPRIVPGEFQRIWKFRIQTRNKPLDIPCQLKTEVQLMEGQCAHLSCVQLVLNGDMFGYLTDITP